MNRLTKWAIRRVVMGRLKAFFGGLATPSTSEFWLGWGGIVMKAACLANGAVCMGLDTVGQLVGFTDGKTMIATVLGLAGARMVSKAAKATKDPLDGKGK